MKHNNMWNGLKINGLNIVGSSVSVCVCVYSLIIIVIKTFEIIELQVQCTSFI